MAGQLETLFGVCFFAVGQLDSVAEPRRHPTLFHQVVNGGELSLGPDSNKAHRVHHVSSEPQIIQGQIHFHPKIDSPYL
jgi:hypothetical protein